MKNIFGLVPIRNFAQLSENLFRSAQPEFPYEYAWLKDVPRIDVLINLREESRHDTSNAPQHGMKVINIDVKDHHEPTKHQAMYFIQLIKAHLAQGANILFHCEHGHGRTSTFCVLARLAMGWTLEQALKEETENFHYNFKHHAQADFLKTHFSNYNKK